MKNIKKYFEKFDDSNVFIKKTVPQSINSSGKSVLNRKGNVLFNTGDIEGARRIFMTTGYSDGLCRVGDFYKSQNRFIEALRMYWIAPDRTKAEPLINRLAEITRKLLSDDEGFSNV